VFAQNWVFGRKYSNFVSWLKILMSLNVSFCKELEQNVLEEVKERT